PLPLPPYGGPVPLDIESGSTLHLGQGNGRVPTVPTPAQGLDGEDWARAREWHLPPPRREPGAEVGPQERVAGPAIVWDGHVIIPGETVGYHGRFQGADLVIPDAVCLLDLLLDLPEFLLNHLEGEDVVEVLQEAGGIQVVAHVYQGELALHHPGVD